MEKRTIIRPISPSLSLDKLKEHLRITSEDLDAELDGKLMAAIYNAEATIGKVIAPSVISNTYRFAGSLRLMGPVIEVLEVKVDGQPVEAPVLFHDTVVMPVGMTGNFVEVKWKAGMEEPPYDIAAAIFLKASRLFNNPGDTVDALTTASDNLLQPYRTWGEDEDDI